MSGVCKLTRGNLRGLTRRIPIGATHATDAAVPS